MSNGDEEAQTGDAQGPTAIFMRSVIVSIRPSPPSLVGSPSSWFASDIATCRCHRRNNSFFLKGAACTVSR